MKKIIWISIAVAVAVLIGRALFGGGGSQAKGKLLYTVSKSQSVCIDPGHGGIDPGAIKGDLTEKALNLKVALQVREMLWKQGYRVYMTRVIDRGETLADRYDFCNATKADIMVSIHQNYFDDDVTDYATALFYKTEDMGLADSLANSVGSSLNLQVTPTTEFDSGLLMKSRMPASIVEGLFMTDASEARQLSNGSSRINLEAQGIVKGITDYLTDQSKEKASE